MKIELEQKSHDFKGMSLKITAETLFEHFELGCLFRDLVTKNQAVTSSGMVVDRQGDKDIWIRVPLVDAPF